MTWFPGHPLLHQKAWCHSGRGCTTHLQENIHDKVALIGRLGLLAK
jgi:hypothetical protein